MIFLNRGRKGPDPYLEWRVRLLFAGGGVALVGIALESRIVVGVAIAILTVGMGLRFVGGRENGAGLDEDPEREEASRDEV